MKRLKGAALIYAVVFSIIILITTGFLVTSVYTGQIGFIRLKRLERANDNLHSAINLLLYSGEIDRNNPVSEFDLFGDGKDLVKIKREQWGLWEVFGIKSEVGGQELQKSLMLGYTPDLSYALAVTGTDRPLNIAGYTQLTGNVYTPSGTFKKSYIEGRLNVQANPVVGSVKPAGQFTSPFANGLKLQLEKFSAYKKAQLVSPNAVDVYESESNSFSSPVKIIYSRSNIKLSGMQLRGKYMVISESKIEVSSTAHLEDVILVAPNIELQSRVDGTMQCFAEERLSVGDNVKLRYPSVLVLEADKQTDSLPALKVGEKSIVAGIVACLKGNSGKREPFLAIEKGAQIYGQILAEGYVQLQGEVYGNAVCASFFLRTPSGAYENTMMDVILSSSRLTKEYSTAIPSTDTKRNVAKWLL